MRRIKIHIPADYFYKGAPEDVLTVDESILEVNPDTAWDEHIANEKRRIQQMETMPLTAKDALALWDAGELVPAFQVETTPERQTEVYATAFELIRSGESYELDQNDLSEREREVARSIAHVAKQSGWAKMVSQHVHRDSPAITVKKPV